MKNSKKSNGRNTLLRVVVVIKKRALLLICTSGAVLCASLLYCLMVKPLMRVVKGCDSRYGFLLKSLLGRSPEFPVL